jgi:ribosomal protein S18 acetylase RimI-like enzyme
MGTTTQPDRRALGFVWRVEMLKELGGVLPAPRVRPGYRLVPFEAAQIPALAEVEFRAFSGSADARAFATHLGSVERAREGWQQLVRSRRFEMRATRVLTQGQRVCGFVQASRAARGAGYITSLAVLPEDRGGHGRALLLAALHRLRSLGFPRAALTVTAENASALRLYEGIGFEEVGWSIATFPPAP